MNVKYHQTANSISIMIIGAAVCLLGLADTVDAGI